MAVRGMNRELTPGVRLHAALDRMDIVRIEPRLDALFVVARAQGSASLELSRELFGPIESPTGTR
jgi:hypothetical protein